MRLTGHDCKRASADDGCLAFGDYSLGIAAEGSGRTVSREEMLDIRRREKGEGPGLLHLQRPAVIPHGHLHLLRLLLPRAEDT